MNALVSAVGHVGTMADVPNLVRDAGLRQDQTGVCRNARAGLSALAERTGGGAESRTADEWSAQANRKPLAELVRRV